MSTIFGKIIRHEIPADIVFEDDEVLVFRDIHPAAPFHVLVIPKRPIVSVGTMTADDVTLVGRCLAVAGQVAREAGYPDFRVVTNSGAGAGQSVFHLHFHVLAGRSLKWPPG